jgi:hypothetical protein
MLEPMMGRERSTIVEERLAALRRDADAERAAHPGSRTRSHTAPVRTAVGRVLIGLGAAILGRDDCGDETAIAHAA